MNKSTKEQPDIVIDLTQPLTSGRVQTDNLLQVQAKNRLDELLNQFVSNTDDPSLNSSPKSWAREFDARRFNNTIFISGHRGAGKTTFLRTVLLEKFNNDSDKILPVAFIDPTLVETHQHILVDIIAKFKQLISEQLSCCGDEDKHRIFNKKLEALAEGLKLLGNNSQAKDNDAAWFLNKALKHAVGGQTLEAKFHELIDSVADILEQKLFIIAIDDVDTDTSKAYEVLELIRRYLTHPKLAVIISGDPLLYSHIVQGQKIKELSYNSQSFKGAQEYEKNTIKLVEHLEQQYLAKVLPVEQRIELKTLSDLIKAASADLQPKIKLSINNNSNVEISEYIGTVLGRNLNLNKKHLVSYTHFMLNQPIRSVLQILKNISANKNSPAVDFLKLSIINSYIGALRKEDINLEALMADVIDPNIIGSALFQLCNKYGELETGFYARPDGNDESYNASQILLSTVISSYLSKRPEFSIGRAFQLMLTSGATCNIYMNNVANNLKEGRNANHYINYIGLNRKQNMFSLAAHFSPFVWENEHKKQIGTGVIRIPRRNSAKFSKERFNAALSGLFNSVNYQRITSIAHIDKHKDQSEADFLNFVAAKTVLVASHSMMTKSEGRDYISCYCLIASLSELLICDSIDDKLSQLSAVQTFGSPAFVNIQGEGDENLFEEDNTSSDSDQNDHDEKLIKLLNDWKSDNQIRCNLSSLMIGKIWARIMYSLTNISEKSAKEKSIYAGDKKSDVLLGTVFSRFIWGIINATLIEEARYKKDIDQGLVNQLKNAKNVTSSPTELIKNLRSCIYLHKNPKKSLLAIALNTDEDQFKAKLPLTYSLISCPLLWPYIGVYLDGQGKPQADLLELTSSLVDKFKDFIEDSEERDESPVNFLKAQCFISRLPIMGCFLVSEGTGK